MTGLERAPRRYSMECRFSSRGFFTRVGLGLSDVSRIVNKCLVGKNAPALQATSSCNDRCGANLRWFVEQQASRSRNFPAPKSSCHTSSATEAESTGAVCELQPVCTRSQPPIPVSRHLSFYVDSTARRRWQTGFQGSVASRSFCDLHKTRSIASFAFPYDSRGFVLRKPSSRVLPHESCISPPRCRVAFPSTPLFVEEHRCSSPR